MLGLFKSKKKTTHAKILVVDDEFDLVNTIQYRLKHNDCDVITACNGKEGLEKATSEKPDLILLDTNMPIMNGHEMLGHLRSDPNTKDIPVIMLTALCEPEDIAKASSHGISDYVTKPFEFSELMDKVLSVLGKKSFE